MCEEKWGKWGRGHEKNQGPYREKGLNKLSIRIFIGDDHIPNGQVTKNEHFIVRNQAFCW